MSMMIHSPKNHSSHQSHPGALADLINFVKHQDQLKGLINSSKRSSIIEKVVQQYYTKKKSVKMSASKYQPE